MAESIIVTQECNECGATFDMKYSNEFGCGSYSFVTEPCECDCDFSPVEGQPSISEWIKSLEHIDMASKLINHIGHDIEIVRYGNDEYTADVCLECLDCGCVIISAEDYD